MELTRRGFLAGAGAVGAFGVSCFGAAVVDATGFARAAGVGSPERIGPEGP